MVVVWGIAGFILGSIVTSIIFKLRTASGKLEIDHSNPEKDTYRFNVGSLDSLSKKKRIVLKVDNHADLSHE